MPSEPTCEDPPHTPVVRNIPAVLWRTVTKAWDDSIFARSAQAAFWQTLSLPPLLLGLIGLLGYVSSWIGSDAVDRIHRQILKFASNVFSPNVVDEIIAPTVNDVLQRGRGDLVSVGFVVSLWAGSSAVSAFVDSIVAAHGQTKFRHPIRQRFYALGLYVLFLLGAVVVMPLIALGPSLVRRVIPANWHGVNTVLFQYGYYPVVALILVGGLTTLYRVALPKPLPWHRLFVGGLAASLVFFVGTAGLRVYLHWIAGRGYTYGALATPIGFLMVTFFLGFAVMLGAELNAVIEQTWPASGTHVGQVRDWLTAQVTASGIDDRGRAAALSIRKFASEPITRPTKRRSADDTDEENEPPYLRRVE